MIFAVLLYDDKLYYEGLLSCGQFVQRYIPHPADAGIWRSVVLFPLSLLVRECFVHHCDALRSIALTVRQIFLL